MAIWFLLILGVVGEVVGAKTTPPTQQPSRSHVCEMRDYCRGGEKEKENSVPAYSILPLH